MDGARHSGEVTLPHLVNGKIFDPLNDKDLQLLKEMNTNSQKMYPRLPGQNAGGDAQRFIDAHINNKLNIRDLTGGLDDAAAKRYQRLMARGGLASLGKRQYAQSDLNRSKKLPQRHKDGPKRGQDSLAEAMQKAAAGSLGNVHPSYFKNQRYQQLYKSGLTEDKGGSIVQPPPQEVVPQRREKRDASGIPLSNQILYEKLDYDAEDRAAVGVSGPGDSRGPGDNFSELRGSTKGRPSELEDQESAYPAPVASDKDAKHLSKKSHHLLPSSIQSKLPTLSLRNLKADRGGMVR